MMFYAKMDHFLGLALFITLLVAAQNSAHARDPLDVRLPDVAVMPGMRTSWIGQRMSVNGVPTKMRQFQIEASPVEVANWYKRHWKNQRLTEITESKDGSADIVALTFQDNFQTVRIDRKENYSIGVLTSSKQPDGRWVDKETHFPLPPRSAVMSRIESIDGGRRAETIQAIADHSVWYVKQHFIDTLSRRNWVHRDLPVPEEVGDAVNLEFQRNRELAQIIVQSAGRLTNKNTYITVQWTKNP